MALKSVNHLLQASKLQEMFPPAQIAFAFYGNHIDRYKYKLNKGGAAPKLDLILAVNDIK
jgi:hypothetical protein